MMLGIGAVFLCVIALGELTHWVGHRQRRSAAARQELGRSLLRRAVHSARAVKDLRDWIALLEREGELVRVSAEVDPDLEITEIVDRTVKAGGPALLFEKPKGSEHPLLINQFGTERRMCLAFGVERWTRSRSRVADVLEMQPPHGLVEKVRGLQKLKSIADSRPKTVRHGRVPGDRARGDDVDLDLLPIQRCWPGDPAPFITLPAVITHDPQTGGRNVGMYRMQVSDRQHDLHALADPQGRARRLPRDRRPASRSPSRSGSTRSPPTRPARRCRSTSTS